MTLAIPQRVLDRVWAHIDVRGPDECWPWTLSVQAVSGYGQVGWADEGRNHGTTAHRVAWTSVNGPIPDGLTVDHRIDRCPGGNCCNLGHLRLLTNEANGADNGNARKARCKRGHKFDAENTHIDPCGHRRCRQCKRDMRAAGRWS